MPEPYDYTFKGLQSPQEAFNQGLQSGNALFELQQQRIASQRKAAQEAQMQQDMAALSANPTVGGIQQIMAKYPAFSEKFKPLLESLNAQQKENRIRQANSIFMPLISGDKELALSQLDQQIEAATNSGDVASQKSLDALKKTLESEKTGALGDSMVTIAMGSFLAEAMGPEQFAKTYESISEQRRKEAKAPSELKESEAKAEKAAIEAKFAESTAVADLEKKGWDIKKIQNDVEVAKQNAKIALMNAQIARETNQLKREELGIKVEEAQIKRDEKVREKAAEADSALTTIDQSNEIITGLLADEDTLRAITGASAARGKVPGTKGRAMAGKIEQLQNTIASANLDKLKGAMSDKDIVFLKNIATSLDRYQDEDAFIREIKRIQKTLADSRSRVARKYGVPETGQQVAEPTQQRNVTVDY